MQLRNESLMASPGIDWPANGAKGEVRDSGSAPSGEAACAAHPASGDRRSTQRMPIELAVRYKVFGGKRRRTVTHAGAGTTLDMSSGGICFTIERALPHGESVELSVSWPARLHGAVPLKLVIVGRLVRVEGSRAAVSIERYEFKTAGSSGS